MDAVRVLRSKKLSSEIFLTLSTLSTWKRTRRKYVNTKTPGNSNGCIDPEDSPNLINDNDTLENDADAHKVVLYTISELFIFLGAKAPL